ncbi:universal stress protein [Nocardiopsis sp. HUAS JQ3]|uniref:universal stress protein n=1 Tax=Nocardiopsis sp. HUAS JQ3 TaxID=3061629 RepID=UPI0023A94784|nr:universal stress protein [Nocardiopsis sp. HUAS JQ3]WDZ93466.1 universal stress protein [Nocardiopsis sp. HUAS JQ3]
MTRPVEVVMERSVLVGVDGSDESLRAVEWAAAEASLRHCRLRTITAFPAPSPDAAFVWPEEEIRASARAVLDLAGERASAAAPGVAVDREVAVDSPGRALLACAGQDGTALVVVGHRGRGGFSGLRVGSVAYRVAAQSSVPVVVVGPRPAADDSAEVVVGDDGSAGAERVLAEAFEAASTGGGPLRVVRVRESPLPFLPPVVASAPRARENGPDDEAALERAVGPLRARYPEVEVSTEVVDGRPVAALTDAARAARLLVVGAGGEYGLTRLALGSAAHGVLHRSPCPVMVVHTG